MFKKSSAAKAASICEHALALQPIAGVQSTPSISTMKGALEAGHFFNSSQFQSRKDQVQWSKNRNTGIFRLIDQRNQSSRKKYAKKYALNWLAPKSHPESFRLLSCKASPKLCWEWGYGLVTQIWISSLYMHLGGSWGNLSEAIGGCFILFPQPTLPNHT